MPSVQPPDSPTGSGSTEFRSEAAPFTAGSELLTEFASEAPPQPSPARAASPGPRVIRNDFTLAARLAPTTPIWLESARRLPPRPPAPTHRTRKLLKSLTRALCTPVWMKRVPNVRWLATSATLTSFGVGSAAGAMIMWFAGAQAASSEVPSPRMLPAHATLPLPELPASRPDQQLQADNIRAVLASEPAPIGATATRKIGTSGRTPREAGTSRRTAREVNTTVTRPPVPRAAATPARKAAAPPAAYRGSLAFRSAPQGARVFLNGQFVGSTPLVLEDLPVGSRAVRIEADGYQRWSASTQVVANQQTSVSATLGPAAQ